MFGLCLLLTLAACVNGAVLPGIPLLDGRIVGGYPIIINQAPYQVALLYDRNGAGSYFQSCGGSIISQTVIVSAGHCVSGTYPVQWRVRAGSTYHNTGGQVIQVTQTVLHSGFTSQLDNDISLLFLGNSLSLGVTVAIVTLPSQGFQVPDGAYSAVTGWGTLSEGGSQPTNLYMVTIPIVNQQMCKNAYASFNPVTSNMVCAGYIGAGGKDACQGDSGGPLVSYGFLIGITSWGRGCAQPSYPGVWTRVSAYRNWINSNI